MLVYTKASPTGELLHSASIRAARLRPISTSYRKSKLKKFQKTKLGMMVNQIRLKLPIRMKTRSSFL